MESAFSTRDPLAVLWLVGLLLFIVVVSVFVIRGLGRHQTRRTTMLRQMAEQGGRSMFCACCSQTAERSASRTGEKTLWDDYFPAWRKLSLAAQYKPQIPGSGGIPLCNLCGRDWDARLELKVAEVVEVAQRKMRRDIAGTMNAYEGGELMESMVQDLAAIRKKAKIALEKQRAANVSAPATGVAAVVVVDSASFAPRGIAPEAALDGSQNARPPVGSPVPPVPPSTGMPTVRPPEALS